MNKYAIVVGGIVENMTRAEAPLADNWIPFEGRVDIGDCWDGKAFHKPVVVIDLDALRAAKNDEINAERLKATFDTFEHRGKAISCDELSRSDIDGINGYVALNGAFPAIWPGVWKCADNSYLPISTIDEWKAFYGAIVEAGSALYAHAQDLKASLSSAKTAEDINSINW